MVMKRKKKKQPNKKNKNPENFWKMRMPNKVIMLRYCSCTFAKIAK